MIRNRILYLLSLSGGILFYGFFSEWFSGYLLLLLLALPWASLMFSLPAMLSLKLTLAAPRKLPRGAAGELAIAMACPLPSPRCRVTLRLSAPLSGLDQKCKLRSLPARLALPTGHCGAVQCQILRGRVTDYLGLWSLPRRWHLGTETLILPTPRAPEVLPELNRPAYRPKPGGGFAEHHELRDYRPGDSLRQVHWKLTAKTGNPIVREPQAPAQGDVVLTVDLEPGRTDARLDALLYLSRWLLSQELPHQVRWFSGAEARWASLDCPQDVDTLAQALCRSRPAEPGLAAAFLGAGAFWHHHVT